MRRRRAPEKDIQKACLQWLVYHGCLAWRQNSGAMKGSYTNKAGVTKNRFMRFNSLPGMSDLCAVLPGGKFAAVEIKRDGGKLTELQADFLARVRRAGGVGVVVRSVDELAAALAGHVKDRRGDPPAAVDGSPLDT